MVGQRQHSLLAVPAIGNGPPKAVIRLAAARVGFAAGRQSRSNMRDHPEGMVAWLLPIDLPYSRRPKRWPF